MLPDKHLQKLFIDFRKCWLPGLLLFIFISFFYFHLYTYLTLSALKQYQTIIQAWTIVHYKLAVSFYILIFTLLIACGIPCATFLALTGGFLFGNTAIFYAALGTTLGGLILFLAIRSITSLRLATQSASWIKKIEHGIQENAFHYILLLRLVPVFPCWISNIGAALLNISLKTFLTATVLGVLPSTIIYVLAGRSLDKILANENIPLIHLVLTPSVLLPLMGISALCLATIIYKTIKKAD